WSARSRACALSTSTSGTSTRGTSTRRVSPSVTEGSASAGAALSTAAPTGTVAAVAASSVRRETVESGGGAEAGGRGGWEMGTDQGRGDEGGGGRRGSLVMSVRRGAHSGTRYDTVGPSRSPLGSRSDNRGTSRPGNRAHLQDHERTETPVISVSSRCAPFRCAR